MGYSGSALPFVKSWIYRHTSVGGGAVASIVYKVWYRNDVQSCSNNSKRGSATKADHPTNRVTLLGVLLRHHHQ
eukprot:scaffold7832_cov164-Amphora_coffeaeformis.AAC.6